MTNVTDFVGKIINKHVDDFNKNPELKGRNNGFIGLRRSTKYTRKIIQSNSAITNCLGPAKCILKPLVNVVIWKLSDQ